MLLTFCCMNCCQSAILPLAFRVWVETTFSEVDVYVKGTILLHLLHVYKQETGSSMKEQSIIRFLFILSFTYFDPFIHTFISCLSHPTSSIYLYPILRLAHLWDFHFFIVLVTAIPILPCRPVSINQVPVEPKQCFCVVEVWEDLILGHIHVKVLQGWWESKGVYGITQSGETEWEA